MQKTESLQAELSEDESRIRWSVTGDEEEPVVILFVGMHGNEPAGVLALDRVAEEVEASGLKMKGSVYAITGNRKALELGVRYVDTDLNRLWESFASNNGSILKADGTQPAEFEESLEIQQAIDLIILNHDGIAAELYFADLHTTSSESCAFILLNDTLANRDLARKFPVPQILGIEENIRGTLLSYINNLGYRAIGFEAGAHEETASVDRSAAFIWLLLHNCGVVALQYEKIEELSEQLRANPVVPDTYFEIVHHKLVDDEKTFHMIPGFENFDPVLKETPLAYERGLLIRAPIEGRIFMPLYQKKGEDGFLIIREVSQFWLQLSAWLRGSFIHKLLHLLPGVSIENKRSYRVDLNTARFFVRNLFHLLGYRVTEKDAETILCFKR